MEKRRLGDTGYQITPIGLGAWAIGGGGRPEQVDGFIGAAKLELNPEEIAECAQ